MGLDSYIFRAEKGYNFLEKCWSEDADENVVEFWYGRKANAIHGWFVDNVQGGEDDCRVALISEEKLKELEVILGKIVNYWNSTDSQGLSDDDRMEKIKDECAKILPARAGFLFGYCEYDDYFYMSPILDLHRDIKYSLNNGDTKKYNYYYHASW